MELFRTNPHLFLRADTRRASPIRRRVPQMVVSFTPLTFEKVVKSQKGRYLRQGASIKPKPAG